MTTCTRELRNPMTTPCSPKRQVYVLHYYHYKNKYLKEIIEIFKFVFDLFTYGEN